MNGIRVLVTDLSAAESWLSIAQDRLEDRPDINLVVVDQSSPYKLEKGFIDQFLAEINAEEPDWIIIGCNLGSGAEIYQNIPERLQQKCLVTYHYMVSGDYPNLPRENFISRRSLPKWLENLPQK